MINDEEKVKKEVMINTYNAYVESSTGLANLNDFAMAKPIEPEPKPKSLPKFL